MDQLEEKYKKYRHQQQNQTGNEQVDIKTYRIKRQQETGDNVEDSKRSWYNDSDLQWRSLRADWPSQQNAATTCGCILSYRQFAGNRDHLSPWRCPARLRFHCSRHYQWNAAGLTRKTHHLIPHLSYISEKFWPLHSQALVRGSFSDLRA